MSHDANGPEDEDLDSSACDHLLMHHAHLLDDDEDEEDCDEGNAAYGSSEEEEGDDDYNVDNFQGRSHEPNVSAPNEGAEAQSTHSRPSETRHTRYGSYHMPPTSSTPVTSHFDAVLECLDLLHTMNEDQSVSKKDVIESLRSMLNNMLKTIMMHSFATSMSVSGWRVE